MISGFEEKQSIFSIYLEFDATAEMIANNSVRKAKNQLQFLVLQILLENSFHSCIFVVSIKNIIIYVPIEVHYSFITSINF